MLERMPPPPKRTNDPERTKRDILEVATEEFAREAIPAPASMRSRREPAPPSG